ncbi:hypothetical protein [Lysinibacillus xylanilyticus]|uniref:hypothetical protein n=1 Tax=Lysinibacillus xylanilyticus TaxID=582475 RepID=UPI00380335C0
MLYREASKDLANNEEQQKVYDSTGNCVVLAGPGIWKHTKKASKVGKSTLLAFF